MQRAPHERVHPGIGDRPDERVREAHAQVLLDDEQRRGARRVASSASRSSSPSASRSPLTDVGPSADTTSSRPDSSPLTLCQPPCDGRLQRLGQAQPVRRAPVASAARPRASSIAYSGLPPDTSWIRRSAGREIASTAASSTRRSAAGSERAEVELLAATARQDARDRELVLRVRARRARWPARPPVRRPAGAARSGARGRRPDRATAGRRSRRRPGPAAARRRSAASTARPRANGFSSASSAVVSSSTCSNRSTSPASPSGISSFAGRATRTSKPACAHSSAPCRQTAVLPIPGSPRISSARASCGSAAANACTRARSGSRPTRRALRPAWRPGTGPTAQP